MVTLRPDPTFYPSPRHAMGAPSEELAYVALLDPTGKRPDAIGVVDTRAGSKSYGQLVGSTDMPQSGDLQPHFRMEA